MSAIYRSGAALVAALSAVAAIALMMPSLASASLPDGRVYEQVSPPNKSGNVVRPRAFGLASEDGNAVVYYGSGAMGTSYNSLPGERISRRTSSGWATVSPIPTPLGKNVLFSEPTTFVPSSDFSRVVFTSSSPYVSAEPLEGQPVNVFLSEDPAREPLWLGQPTIPNPIPALGSGSHPHDYVISGVSPSLDRVYFTYSGTLLPEDAGRAAYVGGGEGEGNAKPWGFYEWSGGSLKEAGTLPDGSLNPFGAVPAAVAGFSTGYFASREGHDYQAEAMHNEVSQEGTRAFFVSPDPVGSSVSDPSGCRESPCTSEPPELYVREARGDGSHAVRLLSRSELPGHEGEPAPGGVTQVANTIVAGGATYVQGSLDGSHAFFTSTDRLTQAAPEDQTVKEYDFDLETGALTYLPGVVGPMIVSVQDGSAFIFENTETHTIDLWQSGPGGGSVRTIVEVPVEQGSITFMTGGRASADGSVFVFRTNSELPGFNNVGNFNQLYRYDARAEELECVSCPPANVAPSGEVRVSEDNSEGEKFNGSNGEAMTTLDTRVISSDGSRVFFDTPDPLVAHDTNGQRDVYEWENGSVYLISSGKSSEPSELLDSSPSGDDVFFGTASGLVGGDNDEAADAYDARVPRPGDNPPPAAVPCQGEVCQGPPSVPSLLGLPASATFNGLGNVTSRPPASKPAPKKKAKKKKARRPRKRCGKAAHKNRKTAKRCRKAGRSSGRAFHSKGRSR